ncbi:M23 family metallopeptidase [Desulfurobacterium atlanticum]|uniref:Murein DD-endopeptidase MepM and murein hydrolase activator NlpD, contain LysM domain n=1 Tax=Desulfurobacterium atlanticum TaxID=240169 RepID=A0A238Z043_9BACT|nr:M23 family metallopeptidase [Desulfurobacterium atlanticum]SNR76189.1 Murein DD-endopeptidase MepM and murein hydrolase activator NlpD, contain LysM domain [Desulfurobacterium atlanticum]
MAKDRVQIIVIEDELGEYKTYTISPKKIKRVIFLFFCFFLFVGYVAITSTLKLKNVARENMKLKEHLAAVSSQNEKLEEEVVKLTEERDKVVKALSQRVKMIDTIMKTAGIKKSLKSGNGGEGGVYIPIEKMDVEQFYQSLDTVDEMIDTLRIYPFGVPAYGKISSKFGMRVDPFTHLLAFHPGVDISNKPGTPVRVTADGKVVQVGRWAGWGKIVVVRHPSGYKTVYAHLRKIYVKKGQKVKLGQVIGEMGNTGRSTGPHLHYGVMKDNRWINPMKFLEVAGNVWKRR